MSALQLAISARNQSKQTAKNGATNQSENLSFFWSSCKFEVQVHVVKINAACDQNQFLNMALKLENCLV